MSYLDCNFGVLKISTQQPEQHCALEIHRSIMVGMDIIPSQNIFSQPSLVQRNNSRYFYMEPYMALTICDHKRAVL